jgi:hypothetical protein
MYGGIPVALLTLTRSRTRPSAIAVLIILQRRHICRFAPRPGKPIKSSRASVCTCGILEGEGEGMRSICKGPAQKYHRMLTKRTHLQFKVRVLFRRLGSLGVKHDIGRVSGQPTSEANLMNKQTLRRTRTCHVHWLATATKTNDRIPGLWFTVTLDLTLIIM